MRRFVKRALGWTLTILLWGLCAHAQNSLQQHATIADQDRVRGGEAELQTGIALTSQGRFLEAIPHLMVARGQVRQKFAAEFNLALCYVGTRQFQRAVEILEALSISNPDNANVHNLLAQAFVGGNRLSEAVKAFQRAVALTPNDEKLYVLIADACMEDRQYALGVDVTNLGLKHLPDSAKLHYQRGMFLVQLDQFDLGKPDLELASHLGQGTEIAFLAAAQKASFEGNMSEVVRIAREGINRGFETVSLLTMLGEALARSGATPGHPEFDEAERSLEKSVALRKENPVSQIALGKLYMLAGRLDDAIAHLEYARVLAPENPAVYSNLAKAYRLRSEPRKAQDMLAILSVLNQKQEEMIRSAPGERKSSYLGSTSEHR